MAYCSCCGFEKDTIYSECDNCGYPPRLAKTDDESEKKKREDFSQWEEYDPEWLVELAKTQFPDSNLSEKFSKCIKCFVESSLYTYFDFEFANNVYKEKGVYPRQIILDTVNMEIIADLIDGKIGGVEFLYRTSYYRYLAKETRIV